jgi:hypothetical protein
MEQAPAVLTALENCILGSALDAVAPQDMWELPDPADAPHLAAALAAVAAESTRAELFSSGCARSSTGSRHGSSIRLSPSRLPRTLPWARFRVRVDIERGVVNAHIA